MAAYQRDFKDDSTMMWFLVLQHNVNYLALTTDAIYIQ